MRLPEIETPALAVDLEVVERNVAAMADHARRHGVGLRPHAKTHKSPAVAALQLRAGAIGLTVAKVGELEALLCDELADVLVAFPNVGARKLARLLALADRVRITVSLDSAVAARELAGAAAAAGLTIGVLVEVDTGGHRCGVPPGEPAVALAHEVARMPGVELRGIMTHEGHAYAARDRDELRAISLAAGRAMVETAQAIRAAGLDAPIVSVGSTPSARDVAEVAGITEIRPGTYVFHDYNQVRLGVAKVEDCAATVVATVIARPAADRAVIDAGTKAVGADRYMIRAEPEGFGLIKDRPGWFFARASEEHGVLLRAGDGPGGPTEEGLARDDLPIGERVEVIPNHVCPAVNLYDELAAHRGGVFEGFLPIPGRGRSR